MASQEKASDVRSSSRKRNSTKFAAAKPAVTGAVKHTMADSAIQSRSLKTGTGQVHNKAAGLNATLVMNGKGSTEKHGSVSASGSRSQTVKQASSPLRRKTSSPVKGSFSTKASSAVSNTGKRLPSSADQPVANSNTAEDDIPQQEATRDTEDFLPVLRYVKPTNQLQLTANELDEEFAQSLTAIRPGPGRVLVRFNLEEKAFKAEPQLEQMTVHYAADGSLFLRASEEGQRVIKAQAFAEAEEMRKAEGGDSAVQPGELNPANRLRNQFNFSERGAQTTWYPLKQRGTSTDLPKIEEASSSCSQWEIYEAYAADYKQQRRQEDVQQLKASSATVKSIMAEEGTVLESDANGEAGVLSSAHLHHNLKIVERMESQNQAADVLLDFKYWEDDADTIRELEGTLLPLWTFNCTLGRQKEVTCLCWSHTYSDLCMAAFGTFDCQNPTPGTVLGFSLKNPSHPEFVFRTKSGASALSLHPLHPHLLAVGCRDGSVLILDIRNGGNAAPLHRSSASTRPICALSWQPEQHGSPLRFQSLSSDGRLLLWSLATAELRCQEVLRLTPMPTGSQRPEDETSRPILEAGCCLDFHPELETIFIVGTEEGSLHKCSSAHRTGFLMTYAGHDMAVYAVCWNKVQPQTFLSASADWTVKLWHTNEAKALMTFALGCAVGDVAWSPRSATIFAAVTDDGLARVFDLHQNAAEPLCEQRIAAKSGLTRLAFNPKYDVILIGDDRGNILTLKLSPNLRKYAKSEVQATRIADEQRKLELVLIVARKRSEAVHKALASQCDL